MNIDFINVTQKIQLQVSTDLGASEQVLSWFEQINRPPIADEKLWWQCQTLLIEGFINIVEHAHKGLPQDTPIDIEAIRFDQHIEIRMWSYGQPFYLESTLQKMSELHENFDEGGRGLKIMSAIADKLSYDIQPDNRQCLFISKKIW
ncbi:anti-sigma regulatory factor [Aetokthonos hydrillicola Thurmond2011]|jgi:serine/threonine-protein kinase RsbW|uniref:Anti-sigma regulatory factor n=1 Tax=Aetokthonos hydrillicola Thurmond2011 TaxID=2712845 RepID=A0AAP5I660_9CYAN|nr:anti-sigma regulatory factor [Aetokthonos hydrillicola]MBO3461797.1 anti-sigma regulatory factor [Aetokthonos hydrillicola CCALA 1050]MBW4589941.1 anti-sigma regulatory factor [Aetokthonos hydrillicola CCALA 1050]MDR9895732.1 anti-sigma regulatory factor [Aetokthonos hydrillicola Thurmond2011]